MSAAGSVVSRPTMGFSSASTARRARALSSGHRWAYVFNVSVAVDFGEEADQLPAPVGQRLGQHVVRADSDEMLEGVDEGLVGDGQVLVTTAEEHEATPL